MDNKKTVFIIAGSLIAIFGILMIVYKLTNTSADYSKVTVVRSGDHVTWSPAKKHILVEYSDLQCPACQMMNELLRSYESSTSAHKDIPQKVTLVYRSFPLYQIHPDAFPLAYGAEAAGNQGKFFPMINAIFDDQAKLEQGGVDVNAFLLQKAQAIGLNIDRFKQDMNSPAVKQKVDASLKDGEQVGIDATPTFFLDGQKMEYQSVDQFVQMLSDLK